MKKVMSTFLVLILSCTVLAGCSSGKDADTDTLFVEKKGAIVEVSVGDFDKDYYDEDEFKQYIKDEIAAYKDGDGTGSVKLDKITIAEDGAKLAMKYSDSEAYTAFVGEEIFTGTIVQAIAAGYDFNVDFKTVEDAEVKDAVDKSDVISNDDYHVAIVTKAIDVNVSGTICYVSDGVKIKDKSTATIEESQDAVFNYIIYK